MLEFFLTDPIAFRWLLYSPFRWWNRRKQVDLPSFPIIDMPNPEIRICHALVVPAHFEARAVTPNGEGERK